MAFKVLYILASLRMYFIMYNFKVTESIRNDIEYTYPKDCTNNGQYATLGTKVDKLSINYCCRHVRSPHGCALCIPQGSFTSDLKYATCGPPRNWPLIGLNNDCLRPIGCQEVPASGDYAHWCLTLVTISGGQSPASRDLLHNLSYGLLSIVSFAWNLLLLQHSAPTLSDHTSPQYWSIFYILNWLCFLKMENIMSLYGTYSVMSLSKYLEWIALRWPGSQKIELSALGGGLILFGGSQTSLSYSSAEVEQVEEKT